MKIDSIFTELQKREMQTPSLLLLAAHQPLAFLAAQFLYFVDPIAKLAGWQKCGTWAAMLSTPEKVTEMTSILRGPSLIQET